MKKMHAIEKAAIITGFLSLVGLISMLFVFFYSPAEIKTANTSSQNQETREQPQPVFKTEVPARVEEPLVSIAPAPIVTQPAINSSPRTIRKAIKLLPALAAIKQSIANFSTLRRQAIKQQRLLEKLQEEEWKELELQDNVVIEAEPVEAPVKPTTQLNSKKKEEEGKPGVIPEAKKPAKLLTREAEKAILEEASKNAADINKKQLMRESGKMQVREMRQRPDGSLTNQQLQGVFDRIVIGKGEHDNDASCVHIQSLPDTEKAAQQINIFLRSKGFIMAGRGEAPPNARGISVDASGKCIVVIVGRL